MPSNNTLNQTPDAPSQEGAPENECNHPCGCSQATYLLVEPDDYAKEEDYDFVAPLGYRRAQRDEISHDFIMSVLDRVEVWAQDLYNKTKTKQEDRRNKNHTDK